MYTLGDVHALRTAAQFLALLSLAVTVLLVARRRGMHNVQHSVDKLRRICCLAMVASAALFEAANTRNKQEDADLPQRTWRHYDSRTDFRRLFRFAASDVPRLIAVLGFDGDERAGRCRHQNYVFTADLAISVLLHTMTCDATLHDLNNMFGVKRSKASAVLQWSLQTVYERWHRRLFVTDFKRWAPSFPAWAAAVFQRQGRNIGYNGVVGFVDGTFFATTRPKGSMQKCFFSGHKWDHGLIFQLVLAPNGLIIDFCGPFEGRHQDKFMLNISKVLDRYAACMRWASSQPWGDAGWLAQRFYLYGDAGYNRRAFLQTQFQCPHGGQLSPEQTACNYAMSRVRVPNEWIFGRMQSLWPYIGNESHMHIGTVQRVGNVARIVWTAAVLTNAMTCCDGGNATSEYFGMTGMVPTLEAYFGGAPQEQQCPTPWYEDFADADA
jgi:DDE superfamily endonuclease